MVSPDGQEIAFTREFQGSQQDLWTLHVNLPGSQKLVARLPNRFNTVLCWSADGHGVLIRSQGTDTQQDLQLVTLGDSARVRPLLATRFNEPTGAISPDGKWLAYISDESGSYECRVRPFPAVEGPVQVVSRGAWTDPNASGRIGEPVWRRDGRKLMYAAADGRTLMSVTVTPGNPLTFGEPRRMFRLSSAVTDMVASPDLDRFILSITRDEEGRPTATVILNWPRLLENAK